MIALSEIFELEKGGVLKAKVDPANGLTYIGPRTMSKDDMQKFLASIGCDEWHASEVEVLNKIERFVKSLSTYLTEPYTISHAQISFKNILSKNENEFDTTFYRIHIEIPDEFSVSFIHGMPGNGTSYAGYDKASRPIGRYRNAKAIAEYLNDNWHAPKGQVLTKEEYAEFKAKRDIEEAEKLAKAKEEAEKKAQREREYQEAEELRRTWRGKKHYNKNK